MVSHRLKGIAEAEVLVFGDSLCTGYWDLEQQMGVNVVHMSPMKIGYLCEYTYLINS